ncbi:MAG TPA: hypothetical protein VFA23_13740 [Dongiaceae bacterium]|nr:hypothetical protein [Dongiaceae bacterium]
MRQLSTLLLLLLAACATPTAGTINWQRQGASAEDTRADLQACTRAARAQVQSQHVDNSLGAAQMGITPLAQSIDAYSEEKRIDQLTQRCMTLLGYQPAPEAGG